MNTDVSGMRLRGGNVEDSLAGLVCQTAVEATHLSAGVGATIFRPHGVEHSQFPYLRLVGWAGAGCRSNIVAEAKGIYEIATGPSESVWAAGAGIEFMISTRS